MQIQVSAEAANAIVDSLEFAIEILQQQHDAELPLFTDVNISHLRRSIEDLQMIRVSYMLIARNAAKEQREGRANGSNESRWASAASFNRNGPHDII